MKDAFDGYTIYYHATTTRGHPGTCAPLQNTQEETSKIQQLQAGITRVVFGSKGVIGNGGFGLGWARLG